MNIIKEAKDYAKEKHDATKKLYNGKPFFVHPEFVAKILFLMTEDDNLIAASYLHDTLEDTDTTYEELRHLFGADIADLVQEVTEDEHKNFPNLKTERGLMLKSADQLANVSSYKENTDEQKRIKLFKKYSYGYIHRGDILRAAKI